MYAKLVRLGLVIGEGNRFGSQMRGLGKLHLDGVHAGFGLAVMTGRPSALEAAIEDRRVALRLSRYLDSGGFDGRRAGLAHIRPDVEIRQLAFEQERDVGPDRMAVI